MSKEICLLILLLPTIVLGFPSESRSDCPICLQPGPEIKLPCNHAFHRDCIINWFREDRSVSGRLFNCPLCRHSISMLDLNQYNIDPEKDLNLFNSTITALISSYKEIKYLGIKLYKHYLAFDDLLDVSGKYEDDDLDIMGDILIKLDTLGELRKKAESATRNPKFKWYFDDDDDDDDNNDYIGY